MRAFASVAIATSFVIAHAQQEQGQSADPQIEQRRGGGQRGGAAGPMPGGPPPQGPGPRAQAEDTRSIDEVVKDFTKIPGLVTLYRQKKGASDTVYLEVPESMMNKLFLLQVTSGSGLGDTPSAAVFHGMPLDDIPLEFRKVDDSRIELIRPNLAHRSSVPEVKRMIERSFPDEVLASLDIHSRQPDRKSYLVDVGPFFKSDVAEISGSLGGGGALSMDPSHAYIDSIKNFPENTVIHSVYSLVRRAPGAGPKTVPWSISYNLSLLPTQDGYQPRHGDPRVGFFTQGYQNLDNQSSRDQFVNMIERWNLKKADPSAKLSPPVKPIVFYIDNAVPREFRDDVRRGLLMWNPAFARIGIKDPIVVKQMPDNADWDIADLRYNVVRWTTGMPFAIALMRANPLTGEILNASINFDGVFAAGAAGEFDEIVTPTALYNPEPIPLPGKLQDLACDMQQSSAQIAAEGANLFEGLSAAYGIPFDKKAYIHQRLTEVVCHEMGHCLGLRHNFISSTQITLKQLGDPAYVANHGTSASVMDYVPYNVAAFKKRGVDYYQTTVGDYDRWAISYGYKEPVSDSPTAEQHMLSQIAREGSETGHRYLSDGTADDYDPADVRYDFSGEPLDWASKLMNTARYLLVTSSNRRIKNGESYYNYSRSWTGALNTYLRAASYVPRYIGGVNLSNGYKGDPGAGLPITPLPAAEQKKALHILNNYVFSETAFKFPKDDLDKLTFNPNASGNEASGQQRLFPIRNQVGAFQSATLRQVFNPNTMSRITNNEFRSNDTLTLAQLFRDVNDSVWSELSTGHEISDLRRQLQRDDLTIMIDLAVHKDAVSPDDARALALAELHKLKGRIEGAHASGPYGKAHLADCLNRINQALSAHIEIAQEAPAAPAFTGRRGG
ncbi:MAG TPA: zinc-dependent metalloprotease [Fimbriimonas sp.]|nr:zinc-dependent metalloprotease [Fimbriimonas sp.]